MSGLNINAVRCEALFTSPLQQSDCRTPAQVHEAIRLAIREFGSRGCAARVAQEFGDHPETAVLRMRWVREQVAALWPYAGPSAGQRFSSRCSCTTMDQVTSLTGRAPLTRTSVSRCA
jgi:hypothetical protein